MVPPILDEHGQGVPTRPCHIPNCDSEWPQYRDRFEHLVMIGWARPRQVIRIVN